MDWDTVPEEVQGRWRSALADHERAEAGRRDTPHSRQATQAAATAGHHLADACRDLAGHCAGLPTWAQVLVRVAERYHRDRATHLDLLADTLALVTDRSWWVWPQLHRLRQLRRRHEHNQRNRWRPDLDSTPTVTDGNSVVAGWALGGDVPPERVLTLWTAAYAEYQRTDHDHWDTPDDLEATQAAATAGHRMADACRAIDHTSDRDLPPWLLLVLRIAEGYFRDRATRLDKNAGQLALITLTPWSWLRQRQRNRLWQQT